MLGVIASSRRKIREDYYQLFKDRVIADGGTFIENPIVFNSEKLILTPNAYKEDVIYAALPIDGSGDFAFSRNSSATYIEDGIIKTALPNVPRFQDGKILIEGQATNLVTNSENLAEWGRAALVTAVSEVVSPNDIDFAYKMTNNATGFSRIDTNSISFISGEKYYISFFANKIDWDLISIRPLSGGQELVQFDIAQKTANFVDAAYSGISFEDFSNGWVKVKAIYTPTSTFTSIVYFRLSTTSTPNNVQPSVGMNIWGVEIKENNSSYIKSDGTAVTRLADIATVTPPIGVTEIIETIDGVEQAPITVIPPTYQLPVGNIDNVKMI